MIKLKPNLFRDSNMSYWKTTPFTPFFKGERTICSITKAGNPTIFRQFNKYNDFSDSLADSLPDSGTDQIHLAHPGEVILHSRANFWG